MFKCIIANLADIKSKIELKDKCLKLNKLSSNELSEGGTLWILSKSIYSKKEIVPTFLILDKIIELSLIDIILVPFVEMNKGNLFNNYVVNLNIFTKSLDNFYLNKDPIREKHIWKDVEWGKRKKNYNPLGKDPGNVWITTKDNRKGLIIEDIPFNYPKIIERILKSSTRRNDKAKLLFFKDNYGLSKKRGLSID